MVMAFHYHHQSQSKWKCNSSKSKWSKLSSDQNANGNLYRPMLISQRTMRSAFEIGWNEDIQYNIYIYYIILYCGISMCWIANMKQPFRIAKAASVFTRFHTSTRGSSLINVQMFKSTWTRDAVSSQATQAMYPRTHRRMFTMFTTKGGSKPP